MNTADEHAALARLLSSPVPPRPQTLYVVDPLPWCPHLDAVRPLPPSGLDVFAPCQDCGSEAENWICLTCYQVSRLTQGRGRMSP